MRPRDVDALPSTTPRVVAKYGSDALQFGELRLPKSDKDTGPFPVLVVIHGGCWTKGFAQARNTAALASKLAEAGIATWNVEYRQVGDEGGGWPGSFQDWAAATDYLRVLARTQPLDLSRVAVTGHSAGGHAALWVAARSKLAKSSEIRGDDPLPVHAAIAIDGPGDTASFIGLDAKICGKPVIEPLMGGSLATQPGRYAQGSPNALLPLGVPQYLVASRVLLPDDARKYQAQAKAAGDRVELLVPTPAGHFDIIAPGSVIWPTVEEFIVKAVMELKGRK
jgi:acetyl esterase/lipase